MNYTIT